MVVETGRASARDWERVYAWWLSEMWSAELALAVDQNYAPIIKSAFPELAEVDRDSDILGSHIQDVV